MAIRAFSYVASIFGFLNISPSGNTAVAYGNDKTYTITADDGYEIKDVLVDGESIGVVTSYTFENVKKAHTISASFAEIKEKTVNLFTDVNTDDWFCETSRKTLLFPW